MEPPEDKKQEEDILLTPGVQARESLEHAVQFVSAQGRLGVHESEAGIAGSNSAVLLENGSNFGLEARGDV